MKHADWHKGNGNWNYNELLYG